VPDRRHYRVIFTDDCTVTHDIVIENVKISLPDASSKSVYYIGTNYFLHRGMKNVFHDYFVIS
jgi:hypothetical protein